MSSDPDAPTDPNIRSGGFVIRNMIFDSSSHGQVEVMSHWRSYEGTRHVDQYNIPPYVERMSHNHPCFGVNTRLRECADRADPEMLLAGRCAQCNTERQALMKCLVKSRREDKLAGGVPKWKQVSVADTEGTWGAWLRKWLE